MLEYRAPERDMHFLLFDLFKVQEEWRAMPAFADCRSGRNGVKLPHRV